jgi:endonuclease YncB( thermonuclease family)
LFHCFSDEFLWVIVRVMRKFWLRYPSTILSVIFLVCAGVYGWFDFRSQQPVLGVTDTRGFEISVVTAITDEYGVVLEDGRTVRVLGIEFPAPTDEESENCSAQKSQDSLEELLLNKVVYLEQDVANEDRYGRTQRYFWVGDRLINHELLLRGAGTLEEAGVTVYTEELRQAARAARLQPKGVWRSCAGETSVE